MDFVSARARKQVAAQVKRLDRQKKSAIKFLVAAIKEYEKGSHLDEQIHIIDVTRLRQGDTDAIWWVRRDRKGRE